MGHAVDLLKQQLLFRYVFLIFNELDNDLWRSVSVFYNPALSVISAVLLPTLINAYRILSWLGSMGAVDLYLIGENFSFFANL